MILHVSRGQPPADRAKRKLFCRATTTRRQCVRVGAAPVVNTVARRVITKTVWPHFHFTARWRELSRPLRRSSLVNQFRRALAVTSVNRIILSQYPSLGCVWIPANSSLTRLFPACFSSSPELRSSLPVFPEYSRLLFSAVSSFFPFSSDVAVAYGQHGSRSFIALIASVLRNTCTTDADPNWPARRWTPHRSDNNQVIPSTVFHSEYYFFSRVSVTSLYPSSLSLNQLTM